MPMHKIILCISVLMLKMILISIPMLKTILGINKKTYVEKASKFAKIIKFPMRVRTSDSRYQSLLP